MNPIVSHLYAALDAGQPIDARMACIAATSYLKENFPRGVDIAEALIAVQAAAEGRAKVEIAGLRSEVALVNDFRERFRVTARRHEGQLLERIANEDARNRELHLALEAAKLEIERLKGGKSITIPLEIDTTAALDGIKALRREIDIVLAQQERMTVHVSNDPDAAKAIADNARFERDATELLPAVQLAPEFVAIITVNGVSVEYRGSREDVFTILGIDPANATGNVETFKHNAGLHGVTFYVGPATGLVDIFPEDRHRRGYPHENPVFAAMESLAKMGAQALGEAVGLAIEQKAAVGTPQGHPKPRKHPAPHKRAEKE